MSEVKIKKAKIKDDLFLEVEFTEELPGHSKKDTKLTCTIPVHEDLKAAFQKLVRHLAQLCDDLTCKSKKLDDWSEDLLEYSVKGFSIGGTGDSEGVTISGSREAKHGIVNLNTPFQQYESSEYKWISELGSDIEDCLFEVREYLFNGKRAPEKQLAMDFGEEGNVDEFEEAAEEA